MYRIRLIARTVGVKSWRKPRFSVEKYGDVETAKTAMRKYVHEQEAMTMRQIGLVSFRTVEADDGMSIVLEIAPALTLYRGMTIKFSIVEE